MVSEIEIKNAIVNFENMAMRASRMLNNEVVKRTPSLTEMFTKWKHKCEARAQVLKWVVGIDYLQDDKPEVP